MMKIVISLILSFFPIVAFSQNDDIYIIAKNGDIFYQRVMECPEKNAEEIRLMIKQSGALRYSTQIIHDDINKIIAVLDAIPSHTHELDGYSLMSSDFIISKFALYSGQVIYEIKAQKYRVPFKDIAFRIPDNAIFEENKYLKELLYNKKNELRNRYNDKLTYALSHTFNLEIAPAYDEILNDNW